MATVTKKQAEGYWNKYNKDGNDELTVEEVKAFLQQVYEGEVDEKDIEQQFRFFGQPGAKTLTKDEFITGMVRTKKNDQLKAQFKQMDKDGNGILTKEELKTGLGACGIEGEQADCILDELEYDGDGKYNIDEFIDVVVFSEFMQQYE